MYSKKFKILQLLPQRKEVCFVVKKAFPKSFCEQLNSISIIDGAYIKPKSEEPSIDDFD